MTVRDRPKTPKPSVEFDELMKKKNLSKTQERVPILDYFNKTLCLNITIPTLVILAYLSLF